MTARSHFTVPSLLLTSVFCCAVVSAQADPVTPVLPHIEVAWGSDSGQVINHGALEDERVVHATIVNITGAPWLRLMLHGTVLAGDPAAEGARLRITSLADGGQQLLNAESLGQWSYSSAYFNGDAVLVEVLAHGQTGASRLVIGSVLAGQPTFNERSICGTADDRVLSGDPRSGRLMPVGCTAWLFNDFNKTFMTAGHCTVNSSSVVQFNVPLSSSSGATVAPPPQHQYPAEIESNQGVGGGVGNDYRYFATFPNSNTGLTAYQAQQAYYTIASAAPSAQAGHTITITGYGTVSSPVSPTWNQVQKTHTGPYTSLTGTTLRYATDTTGGNSGSPVLHDQLNMAIGIHTHAGCTSTGGANQGTAIQLPALQAVLNNPQGICRSGAFAVSGSIAIIGDGANNLGFISTATGRFGATGPVGTRWQGLAYEPSNNSFYAINTARELYRIDNSPAAPATLLGTVSGTALTITGLAYDAHNNLLFGVTQSNGQLWRINTTTLVASPASSGLGFVLGGLEYHPVQRMLYALDDNATLGTRLIRINPETGAMTVVGVLAPGLNDCNGLAYDTNTGDLVTVLATTDAAYRINPSTGAATLIGATQGTFGAQYGMTGVYAFGGCADDIDFNNDGLFPDTSDIDDFLSMFSGSPCPSPTGCDSIDFNGDGLFPDARDIDDFLTIFSGGEC